jgi:signal transduction histidine kinase
MVPPVSAAATAEPAEPGNTKRVLIIESFSRDFDPLNTFTARLKTELAEHSPWPIDFYEASLGAFRTGDTQTETALSQYLVALYTGRPPDLVVPVGGPAARFWWRYRQAVFPATPVLLSPVEHRVLAGIPLGTNDSAVAFRFDAHSTVDNILQTLPATTNIAVVLGNSPLERFWAEECRQAWAPLTNRIHFLWFNTLPFDEICRRAAVLPRHSALLYTVFFVDAAGIPHEQTGALDKLCAVANAPVFGVFEQHLGRGVMGGLFISGDILGCETAQVAVRVLRGERSGANPPLVIGSTPPTYDWRQLQRWRIRPRQLPPGSMVQFERPSTWMRYRWYIVGALGIMIAQAATILGLVLQHSRCRAAEGAASRLTGRIITAQEDERRRIARDLHDDLNQRLALLSVELDLACQAEAHSPGPSKLREIARQVKEVSSEVHKLSYQLHPAKLDQLGLVTSARAFCRELSNQSALPIEFKDQNVPRELPPEIALCIFRVLQEALSNTLRHGQATEAHATLRMTNRHLHLAVSDNGIGFDLAQARNHRGLGLVSMTERARLVHGKLRIRTVPGKGTRVELSVPADIGPAAPEGAP